MAQLGLFCMMAAVQHQQFLVAQHILDWERESPTVKGRKPRTFVHRSGTFWENDLQTCTDLQFKHHLRVGRETFQWMCEELQPYLHKDDK
ncbi:hypothetical protein HDU98_009778, partial [Podochytrium sp. JEL0797]